MIRWSLLLVVFSAAPIVADAIERARQRAGLSHKELALSQGIGIPQWSQQLHGNGHIALDRLTGTPEPFRAALLDELRAAWHLTAPTLTDIYALLQDVVRSGGAASSPGPRLEDRCVE